MALAGVTSAPAELLGLGQRIGKIKPGFDADIVVWDSDPLSVGAAPLQVWIDGASQFKDPIVLKKPATPPIKPDLELSEIKDRVQTLENVVFTGISNVFLPGIEVSSTNNESAIVIVDGTITCAGACLEEMTTAVDHETPIISLKNGYLTQPFTAFGSSLGLEEISAERDTQDGRVTDAVWARAVDGLLFDSKQVDVAHKHGVTRAITPPQGFRGVSAGFKTGAKYSMEKGAVFANEVSVHYDLTLSAKKEKTPSISSAIGALRSSLLEALASNDTIKDIYSEKAFLKEVVEGNLPLVLGIHSADTTATVIKLKAELEAAGAKNLTLIIHGGAESHIVATELAEANIPVVLAPLLAYSQSWDERRSLTGAPLTNGTAIDHLLDAGVLVAISVDEVWETRDLRFLAGIAYRNSGGRLSESEALDLVSTNIYKMLGLEYESGHHGGVREFVVYEGSPLEIGGRIRAAGRGEKVDVWV